MNNLNKDRMEYYYIPFIGDDYIIVKVYNLKGKMFFDQKYSYKNDILFEVYKQQLGWIIKSLYFFKNSKLYEEGFYYSPNGELYRHVLNNLEDDNFESRVTFIYKHSQVGEFQKQFYIDENKFKNEN